MKISFPVFFIALLVTALGTLICYGMASTAPTDPQAVCLTRPWLDVKPPC